MSEETLASQGLYVSADTLLQKLPPKESSILGMLVLEGQSLQAVGQELGICSMTVSRREQAALAALREQLE